MTMTGVTMMTNVKFNYTKFTVLRMLSMMCSVCACLFCCINLSNKPLALLFSNAASLSTTLYVSSVGFCMMKLLRCWWNVWLPLKITMCGYICNVNIPENYFYSVFIIII
jgi:hypothetical protein